MFREFGRGLDLTIENRSVNLAVNDPDIAWKAAGARTGQDDEQVQAPARGKVVKGQPAARASQMKNAILGRAGSDPVANNQVPNSRCHCRRHALVPRSLVGPFYDTRC